MKKGFVSEVYGSREDVGEIGASLLIRFIGAVTREVHVKGVLYPTCSFDESQSGTLYTSTFESWSNFACCSIKSIIKNSLSGIEEDVKDLVFSIYFSCKVLERRWNIIADK